MLQNVGGPSGGSRARGGFGLSRARCRGSPCNMRRPRKLWLSIWVYTHTHSIYIYTHIYIYIYIYMYNCIIYIYSISGPSLGIILWEGLISFKVLDLRSLMIVWWIWNWPSTRCWAQWTLQSANLATGNPAVFLENPLSTGTIGWFFQIVSRGESQKSSNLCPFDWGIPGFCGLI